VVASRRALLASATAVLVAGAVAVAGLDLTGHLRGGLVADPTATPTPSAALDPSRSPAADVLVPEPTATSAASAGLDVPALESALQAPALGPSAGAAVVDVATGDLLLDRDARTARIPASVAKLATCAAVLHWAGPQHRLVTAVVAGATTGQVVLVGGGDATLTTGRSKRADVPQRASLAALADATATALADTAGRVSVAVDDSLFSGPAVSPAWRPGYVAAGIVSPVSALSVDAGRVSPGSVARSADPALAAGAELVRLLRKRGVDVSPDVSRATAPPGARELARVESPTVAELVELALQTSDNDIAEALARVAAVTSDRPGSFDGAREAVAAALTELGVPADGAVLLDGSGLARGSHVAPLTLARLLRAAADGSQPELAALVEGLPVAGFSGTLALRYLIGDPRSGAGVVRAKTGTLTGVSALAGLTSVAGRPTVLVAMTDRVPVGATLQARDDLDRFAALLASGGAKNPGVAGG
jgi:D-alanyl-D-alanine carboxypeptidase/D-alanyl-D-alanine-endopeptidase (penicillin-binding protein 4)